MDEVLAARQEMGRAGEEQPPRASFAPDQQPAPGTLHMIGLWQSQSLEVAGEAAANCLALAPLREGLAGLVRGARA